MFHEQVTIEDAAVQMVVQLPPPDGRYCSVELATPEPLSTAEPETEMVPVSGVPGSVVVGLGAVLSTRRFVTVSVLRVAGAVGGDGAYVAQAVGRRSTCPTQQL